MHQCCPAIYSSIAGIHLWIFTYQNTILFSLVQGIQIYAVSSTYYAYHFGEKRTGELIIWVL
jgi:hypothetical protein